MSNGVSIVIPILNEEKNLKKLVKKIKFFLKNFKYEIIFIDDNSRDNSHKILKKIKLKDKKINYYIRKKSTRDLSQSCILGFQKSKFNNILVMDGDLQHDPRYLPSMISLFNKEDLDFLVGARDFKSIEIEGLSIIRFYASKILIFLFLLLVGNKTLDPMSGFFLFKKNIFTKNKKRLFSKGYKILSDLIYSPLNFENFKVRDHTIRFKARRKGKSKMNLKVLFNILKFIFFINLRKTSLF